MTIGCHAQQVAPAQNSTLAWKDASTRSVVSVGEGAYAPSPPASVDAKIHAFQNKELFLVKEDGRPIPTNKWWSQLVVSRFARSLWAYPLKLDTNENGLDVFFPTRWGSDGRDPVSDLPLHIGGENFKPDSARAKDWSDWTCSFRMAESPTKFMDVTLGEGMPAVWVECRGITPTLTLPNGVSPSFFNLTGKTCTVLPIGQGIGFRYEDRRWGIFTPGEYAL